jgi:nitrate/nitrite transporter NarK
MVELADVTSTIAASGGEAQGLTRERLRMAAVCMLGLALAASILPFCAMGAALGPMMLEFGWGAERVSLSYAVFMWAGAVSLWPVGVLIDRFGPRPVVAAGATVMAAASLTMPFVRHYWQCPVLAVVLGVCGSSGLGYIRIVAALFGARRGLMLGVFAAESTILSQVMPMAMNRLVAEDGWRGAFTTIGVGLLAVAPLLYLGLAGRRDGASWSARWSLVPAPPAEGRTAREIVRDRLFWTVVAAALATAAIGGGALTSFSAAMAAKGFAQSAILHAAPLILAATLAGAICSGLTLDKVGSPRLAAVAFLATAVTYVLWAVVTPSFGGEPVLTTALAIGAFAYAAQLPFVGYFFSRYFGLRAFAAVCGLQAFMQQVFVSLGSPVIGRSLGLIGGYNLLFEAGIAAQVLAALLYLSLPAYRYAAVGEGDGEDAREPVPRARVRSQ